LSPLWPQIPPNTTQFVKGASFKKVNEKPSQNGGNPKPQLNTAQIYCDPKLSPKLGPKKKIKPFETREPKEFQIKNLRKAP